MVRVVTDERGSYAVTAGSFLGVKHATVISFLPGEREIPAATEMDLVRIAGNHGIAVELRTPSNKPSAIRHSRSIANALLTAYAYFPDLRLPPARNLKIEIVGEPAGRGGTFVNRHFGLTGPIRLTFHFRLSANEKLDAYNIVETIVHETVHVLIRLRGESIAIGREEELAHWVGGCIAPLVAMTPALFNRYPTATDVVSSRRAAPAVSLHSWNAVQGRLRSLALQLKPAPGMTDVLREQWLEICANEVARIRQQE